MPSISLAMVIGKEDYMDCNKAITSVSHVVDEIVIVATGPETLYMDDSFHHNIKIFHHPWEDNFSKHRNQALAQCTGDWILILDADEEVVNASDIGRYLMDTPDNCNCLMFTLVNLLPNNHHSTIKHPRLFRNNCGFHYRGIIHNEPMIAGFAKPVDITINHHGYNLSPERMKLKAERRVRLLESWREQEPDNFKVHAYLSHVYGAPEIGRYQDSVNSAQKSMDIITRTKQPSIFLGFPAYPLMQSTLALGTQASINNLIIFTKSYTHQVPHDPAPYWFLCLAYQRLGNWNAVHKNAVLFLALHRLSTDHPEWFTYFENMTVSHQEYVGKTLLPTALSEISKWQ